MKDFISKTIYQKIINTIIIVGLLFPYGFAFPEIASANFNAQINYQGKLTNTSNTAVADGVYHMKFRLYTTSSGGSQIWEDDRSAVLGNRVQVTNGLFSVLLGSSTPLTSINFNQDLWLEVEIGGTSGVTWEILSPRKKLGAVPAAFEADKLDGLSSEQFIRSDASNSTSTSSTFLSFIQNGAGKIAEFFGPSSVSVLSLTSSGNVGIGSTTPNTTLSVNGNSYISGTAFFGGAITATSTLNLTNLSQGFVYTGTNGKVNTIASSSIQLSWFNNDSGYLTSAITAIGPLNQTSDGPTTTFATSTTGTDFTITGSGDTITFNLPTASSANRGLLSSADWTTFNNKLSTYDAFSHPMTGFSATTSSMVIGTSTSALYTLTVSSSTAPQLSLSAGAGLAQWAFRNAGGNFYLSTTTVAGTATTTLPALSILNANGYVGIGTSSPYAKFSVAGESLSQFFTSYATTATSTLAGGLSVNSGAIQHDWYTGVTSIDNLALGNMNFEADSGMISWVDMPVSSSATAGTVQSYTAQLSGNPVLTIYGTAIGTSGGVNNIAVGITTTTPQYLFTIATSTSPQLSLSAGAGVAQWVQRNAGGNFYLSTTTVAGTATTSISALEISGSGFGTTTVRGLNISGQATTTSNVGIALSGGCFSIGGNCLTSYSDTLVNAYIHASTTIPKTYTANTFTALQTLNGGLTVSGATTLSSVAVNSLLSTNSSGVITATSTPTFGFFNATSTNATSTIAGGLAIGTNKFVVDYSSGNVGIGTSSPSEFLQVGSNTTANTSISIANAGTGPSSIKFLSGATNAWQIANRPSTGNDLYFASGVNTSDGATLAAATKMVILSGGNVGIGTTSPTNKLTITDAASSQLSLSAGAGIAQWAFRNAGGNLYFATTTVAGNATTTTSALTILNNGNVGIGTTNPTQALDVFGNLNVNNGIYLGSGGSWSVAGTAMRLRSDMTINWASTTNATAALDLGMSRIGASTLQITNGSSGMGTLIAGNVGIGTASPSQMLTVAGGNIQIDNNQFLRGKNLAGVEYNILGINTSNNVQMNTPSGYQLLVGSVEKVRIDSTGNVGIGTTSPAEKLTVEQGNIRLNIASAGSQRITFREFGDSSDSFYINANMSGTGNGNLLQFGSDVSGVSAMSIQRDSGNVGIGTTTPNYKLVSTSATAPQLSLSAGAGLNQWVMRNEGGELAFATSTYSATSTVSALRINTNGQIQIPNLSTAGFVKSSATGILSVDTNTYLTSSDIFAFPFTVNTGYNSTTTVLGLNGFFSTASSTISGDFMLPSLTQGFAYTGTNGKVNTIASSSINLSWFNNDSGYLTSATGLTSYDAWTHPSAGQSATTSEMWVNGLLSTASTTIVGNATTTGNFAAGGTLFVNQATGRVGIGTTGPVSKLHVSGGDLSMERGNWIYSYGASVGANRQGINFNADNSIRLFGHVGWGTTYPALTVTGATYTNDPGKVGIGNTSPSYLLDVVPPSGYSGDLFRVASSTGTTGLVVLNSGNVGIGTTSPSQALDVNGFIRSDGIQLGNILPVNSTYKLSVSSNTGNTYLRFGQGVSNNYELGWIYNANSANAYGQLVTYSYSNDFKIDVKNLLLQSASGGNVGIGTTSPIAKLQVNGDVTNYTDNFGQILLKGATNPNLTLQIGINTSQKYGFIRPVEVGVDSLNFSFPTGNLGIGTTTPNYKLVSTSATAPQLSLSAGAGIAQWVFRNAGGNFYLGTTTVAGTATTSISALEIAGSGFGTTTVRGLNISGQATTTSNVGINLSGGCFSVGGNCLTSYSDTLVNAYIHASTTIPKTYTANTFTALQTFNYSSTTYGSFTTASTTNLTLGGSTFTSLLGSGLQNTGGALTLNATGNWTGTLDGFEGTTLYQGAVSTSTTPTIGQLAYWTGVGTPSTLGTVATGTISVPTGLTITANRYAIGGATAIGLDTGYIIPLSASTTNWNTFYDTPSNRITAGLNLAWNGNTLNLSTTTLNLTSSAFGSVAVNSLLSTNASGQIVATSTPTFGSFNATSTNATSTIAGGLAIGTNKFVVDYSSGNVGIGTSSPGALLDVWGDMFLGTAAGTPGITFRGASDNDRIYKISTNVMGTDARWRISDGTLAAPALSFSSDATTGLYLPSANNLGIVVGGVETIRVLNTGNVGIGTTSPLAKLSVSNYSTGANTTPLFVVASSTGTGATSTAFIIDSVGNVGVGTANPSQKLEVVGNIYATSAIQAGGTIDQISAKYGLRTTIGLGLSAGLGVNWTGDSNYTLNIDTGLYRLGIGKLEINNGTAGYNSTTTLIVGNIGIGTSTPYARTTIWGGTTGKALEVVNSASTTLLSVSATGFGTTTVSGLNISGSATTTSNVGIALSGGCFSVAGNCLTSYSDTLVNAYIHASTTIPKTYTANTFTALQTLNGGLTVSGATTLSSVAVNSLLSTNASGVITATSTPTFGNFNATSTTATSTIAGGLAIGGNKFVVDYSSGNVGIGTTSPLAKLSVSNYSTGANTLPLFVVASSTGTGATTTAFIIDSLGRVGIGTTTISSSETKLAISNGNYNLLNVGYASGYTTLSTNVPNGGFWFQNNLGFSNNTGFSNVNAGGGISFNSDGSISIRNNNDNNYAKFSSYAKGLTIGSTFITNSASTTSGLLVEGSVGIGTTSPTNKLTITDAASSQLSLSAGAGIAQWAFRNAGGNFYLSTTTVAGTSTTTLPALSILNTNGYVGIGTSSPYAKFSVSGESLSQFFTSYATTATSTFAGGLSVNSGAIQHDWYTGVTSIDNLALGNMNFEADSGMISWVDMPVSSSATVGTVESYTAQIAGNPMITVYGKATGYGGVSTSTMAVGIGTTSPYAKLSVNGNGLTTGWAFAVADLASTTRFVIQDNGKVGVGTTSPFARLSVNTEAGDILGFAVGSSTKSLLSVSTEGFGTTTLAGLNISGSATSTSNVGFNITNGCFAINGTCVGGGSGNVVDTLSATLGAGNDALGLGITNLGTVGIATTSTWAKLSVSNYSTGASVSPLFVVASSTGTSATSTAFIIDSVGNVGIGTTSPMSALAVSSVVTSSTTPLFVVATSTSPSLFSVDASGRVDISSYYYSTSSKAYGVKNYLTVTNTSTSTDGISGIQNTVSSTGNGVAAIRGIYNLASYNGTGIATEVTGALNNALVSKSATQAYGTQNIVDAGSTAVIGSAYGSYNYINGSISTDITNAYGVMSSVDRSAGPITNAYGFYSNIVEGTNAYGMYIADSITGSTLGYGLYSAATEDSYFAGRLGLGTTTPTNQLTIASSTSSQLSLSAGVGIAQWAFRNAGGNFYLGTTTIAGTATTSISALEISGSGFGTTTVRGLNISGQATTTSNVGINLSGGCFSVAGNCLTSYSDTLVNSYIHASTTIPKTYTANTFTALQTLNGGLTVSGATTLSSVAINSLLSTNASGVITATSTPTFGNFNATSTTATSTIAGGLAIGTNKFVVDYSSGNVGIGTTGPEYKLDINGAAGSVSGLRVTNLGTAIYGINMGNSGLSGSSDYFVYIDSNNSWRADGSLRVPYMSVVGSFNAPVFYDSDDSNYYIDPSNATKSATVAGKVGIGTTTPTWLLNPSSATAPQLSLSAGAGLAQWAFRNAGGNFYLGTTTVSGTATTSISALEISGSGFGTTTVRGLNISGQATTTSNVGMNLTAGCFAVNGVCVGGGGSGSGTVNSGVFGQLAFFGADGTAVSGTSTIVVATTTNNGRVGIATSTNLNATLTLQGAAGLDILRVATSTSGSNVLTISSWGGFTQRLSSSTAFSIQRESGVSVFEVDTTSDSNSGIDITASTGQSSNLLNFFSSGGTFLSGFTSAGGLFMNISSTTAINLYDGSGAAAFVVDSTGKKAGIGTSTLTYNLNVSGSSETSYIARIDNYNTTNTADGLLISLGVANASRGTGNYFIGFSDGTQTVAGKIQGGASAVAYTTTAADLAEYFRASDLENKPQKGDIVMLEDNNENSVKVADASIINDKEPIGVISTNPGFVGNGPICYIGEEDCDTEYDKYNVLVAMVGQVPVKVSDENGEVVPGDYLTLSSTTPGTAVKMIDGGYTIGIAMTHASSTTIISETGTTTQDMVKVFIKNGWREVNVGTENGIASSLMKRVLGYMKSLGLDIGNNFVKIVNLAVDKITADRVETKQLCIEDVCVDKTQLQALLLNSGQSGTIVTPPPAPDPTASSTPEVTPDPIVEEPAPEPVVEEPVVEPVPEPITPEPAPEPTS